MTVMTVMMVMMMMMMILYCFPYITAAQFAVSHIKYIQNWDEIPKHIYTYVT